MPRVEGTFVPPSGLSAAKPERTVVYVLFDGFSPAELDAAGRTPHFAEMKREGAWSRHLVPAFPTISLINHTTAYTGCWPEHHGIVSNIFDDPKRGRFDDLPQQASKPRARTRLAKQRDRAARLELDLAHG